MAIGKPKMKILEAQRDALFAEMEAIKNKIAGLEMAMALINDQSAPGDSMGKKTNVKGTILDLLKQAGTTGLNAQGAVEIAQARGIQLDKGSVSSLLSRFKREGLVVYNGDRYKLRQFAHATERPMPPLSVVN